MAHGPRYFSEGLIAYSHEILVQKISKVYLSNCTKIRVPRRAREICNSSSWGSQVINVTAVARTRVAIEKAVIMRYCLVRV